MIKLLYLQLLFSIKGKRTLLRKFKFWSPFWLILCYYKRVTFSFPSLRFFALEQFLSSKKKKKANRTKTCQSVTKDFKDICLCRLYECDVRYLCRRYEFVRVCLLLCKIIHEKYSFRHGTTLCKDQILRLNLWFRHT